MTVPGHVKFWFVGGIAMFFAMSLITSPDKYYTAAQADIETIYNAYGDNAGAEIVKDSNNMFNLIFSSTASGRAVDVMHNTPRKDAAFFGSEQMAAMHTNEILKTFKLEIYAFFLRMSIAARLLTRV